MLKMKLLTNNLTKYIYIYMYPKNMKLGYDKAVH